MTPEQREKLKEKIHEIILKSMVEHCGSYGNNDNVDAARYTEKILEEVEKDYTIEYIPKWQRDEWDDRDMNWEKVQ